jgi:hypothetical protein
LDGASPALQGKKQNKTETMTKCGFALGIFGFIGRPRGLLLNFLTNFIQKRLPRTDAALPLSKLTVVKKLNSALRSTAILFEAPDSSKQAVIPGT